MINSYFKLNIKNEERFLWISERILDFLLIRIYNSLI
jgi:hypothetical protein